MEIQNINNILGDHNINLQNITAHDINIITGKEENPEVKAKKQEITATIADLIKQLCSETSNNRLIDRSVSEDDFDDIEWDDLIEAIKFGNCVLFIGPELSCDDNGKSLHEKFYESISTKNMEYNSEDGFFAPGSETKLINKMTRFYSEVFANENKNGYAVLEKLAQIPFQLIISATPDTTMHQIFEAHNKPNKFVYYNETEQDVDEPEKGRPVIYNFLGNPGINGKFIFTFQQFHDYINQKQRIKIPLNIEAKVSEAVHYLFLGFNFEKWYNRLTLISFNLNGKTDAFTFFEKNPKPYLVNFLEKQFNISSIEKNCHQFVDVLLHKTHQAGLAISLSEIFTQNTLNALERIRVKAIDINKLEPLMAIENEIKQIQQKFFQHHQ